MDFSYGYIIFHITLHKKAPPGPTMWVGGEPEGEGGGSNRRFMALTALAVESAVGTAAAAGALALLFLPDQINGDGGDNG